MSVGRLTTAQAAERLGVKPETLYAYVSRGLIERHRTPGGVSTFAACVATLVLRLSNRVDDDLELAKTVLGPSLTTLGPGTAMVAIAARVAAMLAYERAGGAAVGVAISVTPIPAAAYVGDAIALGRTSPVAGAALVLATNVVLIVAASTATLAVQRRIHRNQQVGDERIST